MKQLAIALLLAVAVNGQGRLRNFRLIDGHSVGARSDQIRFDVLADWHQRIAQAGREIRTRDNGGKYVRVSPWTALDDATGRTVRGPLPAELFPPPRRLGPLIKRNSPVFLPLRQKIDPTLVDAVRDRATDRARGGFGWPSPDRASEIIHAPDRQYRIGNGRDEIMQHVVFAAFPDVFHNPNPAAAHPDDLARVAPGTRITLEQHATIPPIGGQRVINDAGTRQPRNPSLNTRDTISHITLNLVI